MNNILKINSYILNISAILFFALFLSTKSGHSIGTGLAVIGSFLSVKFLIQHPKDNNTKIFAFLLLFLGIFWSHSFDGLFSFSLKGDYLLKYSIGAICVLAFSCVTINPKTLMYAIGLGAVSAAAIAVWQYPARADGYTNAIKFGDFAILFGVMSIIFSFDKKLNNYEKIFFLISGGCGAFASLLSLSRGGWPLIAVIPFAAIFLAKNKKKKIILLSVISAMTIIAAINTPKFMDRVHLAQKEIQGYLTQRDAYAKSSVGARLEQWRLSWKLGNEKPLAGWGENGVMEGRKLHVEQGDADPFVLTLHHSHNDLLNMWSERGIIGVTVLFLMYGTLLYIFSPKKSAIAEIQEDKKTTFIILHLAGMTIPIGFFIFGLSDYSFNLSIGHMLFIFSPIFFISAINHLKTND